MLRVMAQERDLDVGISSVRLSRVRGQVRTTRAPHLASVGQRGQDVAAELSIMIPAPPRWLVLTWLAAAILLSVVLGDVRWGIAAAAVLVILIGLRRVSQRVTFSFGEGFLPYRSDLGWPSGIQEDDDFHWSWTSTHRAS
jgi:hypothetical protein